MAEGVVGTSEELELDVDVDMALVVAVVAAVQPVSLVPVFWDYRWRLVRWQ